MASTAKPKVEHEEPEVDFMADAPPARPYKEAITEQQKELHAEYGLPVE